MQYKQDESIIWCACHNGRFDLDGRVLSGPPPRALARLQGERQPRHQGRHQSRDGELSHGDHRSDRPSRRLFTRPRRWSILAPGPERCRSRFRSGAGSTSASISPPLERLRPPQGGAGRRALAPLVLPGRADAVLLRRPDPVTGILLLMYYQAGESTSYESMRYIVTKVPFGWLVRSIHCWSAHLMILTPPAAHVERLLPARLPQAARAHLVHRHRAVRPRPRLRLLGLPAAVERARLLRDRGRHRLGQGRSGGRRVAAARAARRRRGLDPHPLPLLRPARRSAADRDLRAGRRAPPAHPEAGHGRADPAPGERGRSRRGPPARHAVLSQLRAARPAALDPRRQPAGAAGGAAAATARASPASSGSSASRPIR